MAATVRSTPGFDGTNATTTASSRVPAITSGTLPGELMVAAICWSGSTITLTDPSGWSLLHKTVQTNDNLAVYYRYFVSGDANPTFTLSAVCTCIAACITVSGAMSSGAPVATNVLGGAASTTVTYPAITPAGADDLLVYLPGTRPTTASIQCTLLTLPSGGTGGAITTVADNCTNVSGSAESSLAILTQQLTAATAISQQTGTSTQTVSADCEALCIAAAPTATFSPPSPAWFIQRGLWQPWQGTGSDLATAVTQVTLNDSGAASDSFTVTVAAELDDTGLAADSFTVAAAVPLVDSGTASDSLAVSIPVALADVGSAVDTVTVTVAVPLGDTGSGADTPTVAAAISLADTGTASDSISVQQGGQAVTLNDTGAAADSFTVTAAVPLADSGTATDQVAVTAAVPLADVGSALDSIVVQQIVPKPLSDTGTAADSLIVTVTVPLAELGAAADSIAIQALVGLADTGSAIDSFNAQVAAPFTIGVLTVTDGLTTTLLAAVTAAALTAQSGSGQLTATDATSSALTATSQAGGPS